MKLCRKSKFIIIMCSIIAILYLNALNRNNLIYTQPNNLVEMGLTQEEIANLPKEKLEKYKNFKSVSFESDAKYLKVSYKQGQNNTSTDEQDGEIVQVEEVSGDEASKGAGEKDNAYSFFSIERDIVKTSWLKLETVIYTSSNKDEYAIKTEFEWLKEPCVKLSDTLITHICSQLSMVPESEVAYIYRDYYCRQTGEYVGSENEMIDHAGDVVTGITGCAFTFDLGNEFTLYTVKPYGKMIFLAQVNDDECKILTASGLYAHKQIPCRSEIGLDMCSTSPISAISKTGKTYTSWDHY